MKTDEEEDGSQDGADTSTDIVAMAMLTKVLVEDRADRRPSCAMVGLKISMWTSISCGIKIFKLSHFKNWLRAIPRNSGT
jgi:hypothetical protein